MKDKLSGTLQPAVFIRFQAVIDSQLSADQRPWAEFSKTLRWFDSRDLHHMDGSYEVTAQMADTNHSCSTGLFIFWQTSNIYAKLFLSAVQKQ